MSIGSEGNFQRTFLSASLYRLVRLAKEFLIVCSCSCSFFSFSSFSFCSFLSCSLFFSSLSSFSFCSFLSLSLSSFCSFLSSSLFLSSLSSLSFCSFLSLSLSSFCSSLSLSLSSLSLSLSYFCSSYLRISNSRRRFCSSKSDSIRDAGLALNSSPSFPISKAHSSINLSLSQVITSSSSLPALIRYTLRRSDDLLRMLACISTVNASMFINSQSTVVNKEINTTQQTRYTKGKFRYAVAQKVQSPSTRKATQAHANLAPRSLQWINLQRNN